MFSKKERNTKRISEFGNGMSKQDIPEYLKNKQNKSELAKNLPKIEEGLSSNLKIALAKMSQLEGIAREIKNESRKNGLIAGEKYAKSIGEKEFLHEMFEKINKVIYYASLYSSISSKPLAATRMLNYKLDEIKGKVSILEQGNIIEDKRTAIGFGLDLAIIKQSLKKLKEDLPF